MDEEPLGGGNMNAVVRVGDAVLRRSGPWTATIHALLLHLRSRGFDAAPRPLGIDPDGRERLSFLPGDVPTYPLPGWVWPAGALQSSGRLLRGWHDASTGFAPSGAIWQQPAHAPAEVICHNDFAPHNLVFDGGVPTGVIDVDMASPGPRVWDLAYLATRLVPLSADRGGAWGAPRVLRQRLEVLLAAYGFDGGLAEVLDVAEHRLEEIAVFSDTMADELGRSDLHRHAVQYRADLRRLREVVRPEMEAAD